MKRKIMLQKILDLVLSKETENFFGKNSKIKINNLSYIRSKDSYLINTTLFIDEVEKNVEFYPDALELIIKKGWDGVGYKKPIIIQSSLDIT